MDSFEKISKMNLADLERKTPGREGKDDAQGKEPEEKNASLLEENSMSSDEESRLTGAALDVSGDAEENAEEEIEVIGEPKKMAEPTGRHFYVDATITEKEFTSFLFAHNYRQPILILATAIGIIWPIMAVGTGRGSKLLAFVMAAMFLIYFPTSIWRRAKTAVKKNPAYKNVFHYMIDEWGLHLELGEEAVDVEWKRVYKYMFLKSVSVLYTGKVNAFLIPSKDLGDQEEEVLAFLKEMKEKHK